jgi:hypothetical protein
LPSLTNNTINDSSYLNIKNFIYFYLLFIGNIASDRAFGLFVLLLSIFIIIDFIYNNRKSDILPVTLILNGLISGVVLFVGRGDFGPQQSAASRYMAMSMPIILGCILYIYDKDYLNFFKHIFSIRKKIFKVIYYIFITILVAYFIIGTNHSRKERDNRNLYKFYFYTADSQPSELLQPIYLSDYKFLAKIAETLKANHLNIFSKGEMYSNEIQTQNIEILDSNQQMVVLNNVEFINSFDDPYLLFSGAAIEKNRLSKVDSVYILLNDQKFNCYYGLTNSFVMKISRRNRNIKAGFTRAVPLRLLSDGQYQLKIQLLSADKKIIYQTDNLLTINKASNVIDILYSYKY